MMGTRLFSRPWTWIALSAVLVAVDSLMGPYIQFPVTFAIPVILAANYGRPPYAYGLALALPLFRAFFALAVWTLPWTATDVAINTVVRMSVLCMLAFMVRRTRFYAERNAATLNQLLGTLPIGAWITDPGGRIVKGNAMGRKIWEGSRYVGIAGYGEYKGWWADTGKRIGAEEWALARAITRRETSIGEIVDIECFDGSRKTIRNSAAPVADAQGNFLGAIVLNEDITGEVQQAKEREDLIEKLRKALADVKTLNGLLPLCASCRKVRDDQGYWSRLESYLKSHTDLMISHCLCPECAAKLYPDIDLSKAPPGR